VQRLTADLLGRFRSALTECLRETQTHRIGVAVSGGGDSTALLILLNEVAPEVGFSLEAITIDHGLRPEAAAEARAVAALCADLGLRHQTRRWRDAPARGNLQDLARNARQRLIAEWAGARGISMVALGHTEDDQAETFLLRLARGSGVDGLAAMAPRRVARDGLVWIRPLLGLRRAALRRFLSARNIAWAEDPSNDNPAFARVRMRRAMATLSDLGLDAPRLARTAARLQLARQALEGATCRAAREIATVGAAGSVSIDAPGLAALPAEIRQRLFAHALIWVAGGPYRPRLDSLLRGLDLAQTGGKATLAGCLIYRGKGQLHVLREYAAVAGLRAAPGLRWDGRWVLQAEQGVAEGCHIAALGDAGLAQCPDWRDTGLLRDALRTSPGVWQGKRLVAAPLAGLSSGWSCRRVPGPDEFAARALTH